MYSGEYDVCVATLSVYSTRCSSLFLRTRCSACCALLNCLQHLQVLLTEHLYSEDDKQLSFLSFMPLCLRNVSVVLCFVFWSFGHISIVLFSAKFLRNFAVL